MKTGKMVCAYMAVLCNLVSVLAYAGDIYKWVDGEGNVHYGERAPSNGAKVTKIRSAPKSSHENEPVLPGRKIDPRIQRDKMIQALEGDRRARQERKQKLKKEQEERRMRCARTKDTLRQYKSIANIYQLDAKGNRQSLSDTAKQQEITRLLAEIKKHCK